MQRSLETIVARHEALRTIFIERDGTPLQDVLKHQAVPLPRLDLRDTPEEARDAALRHGLDAEIRRPFALPCGPLLRARLWRVGDEDHVLLLVLHHIVTDAWSNEVLLGELGPLYDACSGGRPCPLPSLPIQYGDYAIWQQGYLSGERLSTSLEYWKQALAGAPPFLELPTAGPRPAIRTGEGGRHRVRIPAALAAEVAALGRREQATLYTTLLAAFLTLLFRYTGQTDLVVGTAIAGRARSETEGLIGLFAGTLALRADLSGDPTFRELLARVGAMTQNAYGHQDVPFERLVQDLAPPRSLGHTPVFQTMFLLQNVPSTTLALLGLDVSRMDLDQGTARFDVTLSLHSSPLGLSGTLDYDARLFESDTIERMVGHYEMLLRGIVAAPDARVSGFPLLPAAERERVVVAWNATAADYPREACVHQLIEAQARRTPDATAVVFDEHRLTYCELEARASRLAHRLRAHGVGPDTLVGICVERSLDLVVGILGILKAGGAYVPVDPSHPRERLASVLADAGTAVLVTQESLRGSFEPAVTPIVEVDAETGPRGAEPEGDAPTPDHLAYVMYTSGSTGKPKGVAVAHRSVVNVLHAMGREPGLSAGDVLLAVTSLSFDIATLELLLPLTVGARVEVVSRAIATDGARLAARLTAGVTVMQATPATWRLLIEAGWRGSPGLRILCGGETLPAELARQLLARGASLWNLYGPTETTIWCTVHRVRSATDPISLGRPIANTRIHILDGAGQPVPIGVPGELTIGGVGLARGYLHQPALTAERFVTGSSGERLFRTGDRARYRADGSIEFLGRFDDQIKLRGFRIEPGEIERILTSHAAVASAAVVLRGPSHSNPRLVAYVVPRDAERPEASTLRDFLRGRLPDYMVPTAFVVLDRLPLTANRKLDRAALPDPDGVDVVTSAAPVGPRTRMETILVVIWQELLGVRTVGVRDNFFDLGGHSLLAMRAIARVERETGRRLNPGDMIFQTLEQVARQCEDQPLTEATSGLMARLRGALKRTFARS
jgi:amino acid adenylation domain-containing protein